MSEAKYADWSRAPKGAMFHTIDSEGTGEWWFKMPRVRGIYWKGPESFYDGFAGTSDIFDTPNDWKRSLEPRPAASFKPGDRVRIKQGKEWVGMKSRVGQKQWQPEGHELTVVHGPYKDGDYQVKGHGGQQFLAGEMLEPYPQEATKPSNDWDEELMPYIAASKTESK